MCVCFSHKKKAKTEVFDEDCKRKFKKKLGRLENKSILRFYLQLLLI